MNDFINLFGNVTLSTAISFVAAVSFMLWGGYKIINFIIDCYKLSEKKAEELKQLVQEVAGCTEQQENIVEILGELKTEIGNVKTDQESLRTEIKKLENNQKEIDKQTKAREVNRLRNKLMEIYHRYKVTDDKDWTESECANFMAMYKDYESLGGNDFIHSVVYPYMMELIVVPDH